MVFNRFNFVLENAEDLNINGLSLNEAKKQVNKNTKKQTDPPSLPICELYPSGDYPVGEIHEYTVPKYMNEWV